MLEPSVINDDVMGGRSQSTLRRTAQGLLFEGEISLEQGGGFASFRAPLRLDPSTAAIEVAVRGDGQRYRFVLRTDERHGTPQYQAPFEAPRDRTLLRFVPADFVARLRGRTVSAPPLRLSEVVAYGVLIADRQSGPFRLEVEPPHAG
jgi:NADH dehydrogenase [ubiquinone] 1 alpha subcomplex assembly factor 1